MPTKRNGGKKSQALQVLKDVPYPIISPDAGPAILMEALDAGADQWKFTRLRIPTGGMTTWTISTIHGEEDTKEVTGVLGYHRGKQLAWWKESFDDSGGGTPPDCASADGVTGNGDNGTGIGAHRCKDCPHYVWGSDRRGGRGKDCRETMQLFFFREGAHLPNLLVVPPTSINAVVSYITQLGEAGMVPGAVVTGLSLEKDSNPKGIAYSKLKLRAISMLDGGSVERMRDVKAMMAERIVGRIIDIEARDVSGG